MDRQLPLLWCSSSFSPGTVSSFGATAVASVLVISGTDVHAYERSCGMIGNWTCADDDSQGTVHIVNGAAGNVYNPDWVRGS